MQSQQQCPSLCIHNIVIPDNRLFCCVIPLSTIFGGLLCTVDGLLSEITWHIAHGNVAYSCIRKVCTKANEIKVYFYGWRRFVYPKERFLLWFFFQQHRKKSIDSRKFIVSFFFLLRKPSTLLLAPPSNRKKYWIHPSIHHIYLKHIAFIKPFVQSFWLNTQRKEKLLSLEEMYDKQSLISYLHMHRQAKTDCLRHPYTKCNSCASCICGSTIISVCVCLVCAWRCEPHQKRIKGLMDQRTLLFGEKSTLTNVIYLFFGTEHDENCLEIEFVYSKGKFIYSFTHKLVDGKKYKNSIYAFLVKIFFSSRNNLKYIILEANFCL